MSTVQTHQALLAVRPNKHYPSVLNIPSAISRVALPPALLFTGSRDIRKLYGCVAAGSSAPTIRRRFRRLPTQHRSGYMHPREKHTSTTTYSPLVFCTHENDGKIKTG